MSKIHRNESQVSRDFDGTLNSVLGIKKQKSRVVSLNLKSDKSYFNDHQFKTRSINASDINNINKDQPLSERSSFDPISNDWNSLNGTLDDDLTNESEINVTSLSDDITSEDSRKRKLEIINEGTNKSNVNPNSTKISKTPYFFGNILSTENNLPFEVTGISNLAFNLTIIMEDDKKYSVKVYDSYTIEKVIEKLSKKSVSLPKETISLYYKKTRLESHITLSWYKIKFNSHVFLKTLQKVDYQGLYLKTICPISIYTSEKVIEIKKLFSEQLNISPESLELKYKEINLTDNKEFFLYNIIPGSTIDILRKKLNTAEESPHEISPGFEISQHWQNMTSDLKHCNCEERRIQAMKCGILSMFDKKYKHKECLDLLLEFTPNLHHKSCIKSKRTLSVISLIHEPSLKHESKYSESEVSLDDCINAEIERMTTTKTIVIEKTDLEYLCDVKNFRSFKRFLREKIGTKCNLRNVALLHNYAKELVEFIGPEEKNADQVNTIISYTKRFFIKYYEKGIIAQGGLINFTLTAADVN